MTLGCSNASVGSGISKTSRLSDKSISVSSFTLSYPLSYNSTLLDKGDAYSLLTTGSTSNITLYEDLCLDVNGDTLEYCNATVLLKKVASVSTTSTTVTNTKGSAFGTTSVSYTTIGADIASRLQNINYPSSASFSHSGTLAICSTGGYNMYSSSIESYSYTLTVSGGKATVTTSLPTSGSYYLNGVMGPAAAGGTYTGTLAVHFKS